MKTMAEDKPSNPLGQLLGGLMGKNTSVDVKPKNDGIHIEVNGITEKIALKHIRNMINEIIGE
jgi:citrate lyase gamma subunit